MLWTRLSWKSTEGVRERRRERGKVSPPSSPFKKEADWEQGDQQTYCGIVCRAPRPSNKQERERAVTKVSSKHSVVPCTVVYKIPSMEIETCHSSIKESPLINGIVEKTKQNKDPRILYDV